MKNKIIVVTTCPVCGDEQNITVSHQGYCEWKCGGASIQNAMPELSKSDREALISGVCDKCWEYMYGTTD